MVLVSRQMPASRRHDGDGVLEEGGGSLQTATTGRSTTGSTAGEVFAPESFFAMSGS